MQHEYLFQSTRLGFRNWTNDDLNEFAKLNADPAVMEHFPGLLTREETKAFIERLKHQHEKTGYTYFATAILETGEFIGFIGLGFKDFKAAFTPATDIGWRLKKSAWGKGYATEGAKRCLEFAFETLKLEQIISICPLKNVHSERVMKNSGMEKQVVFKHPQLQAFPELEMCSCYQLSRNQWLKNRSIS